MFLGKPLSLALLFSGYLFAQPPVEIWNESVLYRVVPPSRHFEKVPPFEVGPKNLYVRWDNGTQKYVWVTGDNRHEIMSGSRVRGGRLGHQGTESRNWYELDLSKSLIWYKVTDRVRPEVLRKEGNRIYRSEIAPLDWEKGGAQLDPRTPPVPLPPVVGEPAPPPKVEPPPEKEKIGCRLSTSSNEFRTGDRVIVSMTTEGPVISAELNGAAVDFPRVIRSVIAERPSSLGKEEEHRVVLVGTVKGHQQSASCELVYSVIP